MTSIELDGGKYTVVHENGEGLHALRYGGAWRDLCGDGLVLAMVQEIEQLHEEMTILAEERNNARRNSSAFENRMGDLQVNNGKLRDHLNEVTAALKSLLRSLCRHEGEDVVGRVKGTWSADVEQAARDVLGALRRGGDA